MFLFGLIKHFVQLEFHISWESPFKAQQFATNNITNLHVLIYSRSPRNSVALPNSFVLLKFLIKRLELMRDFALFMPLMRYSYKF